MEPVCFDIMEMIGKEYVIIKQMQKNKQKMSHVLDEITQTDEYDINCNDWCMEKIYYEEWWDWDDQCRYVGNHYEKYPNPYIKLNSLRVGSMASNEIILVPTFMIELRKAYSEKYEDDCNERMYQENCDDRLNGD